MLEVAVVEAPHIGAGFGDKPKVPGIFLSELAAEHSLPNFHAFLDEGQAQLVRLGCEGEVFIGWDTVWPDLERALSQLLSFGRAVFPSLANKVVGG